ncbi:MAG: transglycosylase SLT domain-containing protein, partial [Fibrobacteres bacterium]|nr:transglycosylase SLT domain-containing protein [Fibrobacterota bacterium]
DSVRVVYDTIITGRSYTPQRRAKIRESVGATSDLLRKMAETNRSDWNARMVAFEKLWGRTLTPDELLAAADRVRHQQGIKERFVEGIKRSGRYLPYIRAVFREYGLPDELALLPHVESSFDYTAYSKVGAAGIWQFMRGTGKQYKMRIGNVIDERLDPMKATIAAAKMLSSNYRKLNSWPLAITAYNHGPKSMTDAVAIHGTTDIGVLVSDYQRKSFKFASKNFYASYVAAYTVAVNYQKYFGKIEIYPPLEWNERVLTVPTRPSLISDKFKIPLPILKQYNLDIRPTAFTKNLALPAGHHIKLPKNIDSLLETQALFAAAEKNVTVPALPEPKPAPPATPAPVKSVKAASTASDTLPEAPPLPANYLLSEVKPKIVVLQSTDSVLLHREAAFWYSSMLALKEDKPVVDMPCLLCPFDSALYDLSVKKLKNNKITIYAQIDETIHHIADWAGISYKAILAANRSISRKGMKIGQKITIPLDGVSAQQFAIERLSYHLGIEEDFFNNYTVNATDTVMIKTGGQVWEHCLDNDIPFWLIMKANPQVKNWNVLRPQQVYIPVIAPVSNR